MDRHRHFMKLALELAEKGRATVSPNPMVGCVIARDGRIVGQGYHRKAGQPHAEALALKQAGKKAKNATMYVTLEPCSHFGRTPPCSRAIIASGIREVVIAMQDPNPKIHGIADLRHAGIEVAIGTMGKEARKMNEAFVKYITTKMPFVTLKLAVTLDGNIATSTGSSKCITSKPSQKLVHTMRTEADAVMVGKNTVLRDNPRLTPRHAKGKDPWKVVVDSTAALPLSCNLMKNPHKLIVATTGRASKEKVRTLARKGVTIVMCPSLKGRVNLKMLLKELGKKNIVNVLMEGGAGLATAAIKERIVDKMAVFIAPKLIGEGIHAFGDMGIRTAGKALLLKGITVRRVADDVLVEGYA